LTLKADLRLKFLEIRQSLPLNRRQLASETLCNRLKDSFDTVLSFCSLGSEIDTQLLNQKLALDGRLFLPRCNGEEIDIYKIPNFSHPFAISSLGCSEPNPSFYEQVDLRSINLILVPGLSFDVDGHRWVMEWDSTIDS
jgi:5,10-methenyltetrahydrofolate synthetase